MSIHHANFASTTLGAAITTTDGTSITVTSEAGFPAVDFIISIDTEAMLVTNVAGTTWTVTRGYEGSTAATHLNGAAIYHDISAAEADAIAGKKTDSVSATDKILGRSSEGSGPIEEIACTAAGRAILDDVDAAAQLVTLGALPKAGGTMSGAINMGNKDISALKLLKLNSEIDDGNSGTADVIDWNAGAAHKSTLTGNVTLAFTGYGPTVVPTMTANNAPSGLVIAVGAASITGSGVEGWRAFDGDLTASYFSPETGTYPQGIGYQFASAKTIIAYAFKTGNQSQNMPTAWTFDGSNDGSSWTNLHTLTGQSCSLNTLYYFVPTSTGSYTYYRIQFTAGGAYGARLFEVYFIEAGIVNPAAPCFLTLKLIQDATGGRTVTWPATVKGTPAINLAANSVSNVLLYWDGTYYRVLNGKQFASATDKLIGRSTAGAGELEEIDCTAAGRALLDDANAAAQLTTLGAAAAATAPVISTGTAAPSTTPAKVGDIYIDTTGAKAYIAKGTSSSADWMLLN